MKIALWTLYFLFLMSLSACSTTSLLVNRGQLSTNRDHISDPFYDAARPTLTPQFLKNRGPEVIEIIIID